jgi:hypothetical protein
MHALILLLLGTGHLQHHRSPPPPPPLQLYIYTRARAHYLFQQQTQIDDSNQTISHTHTQTDDAAPRHDGVYEPQQRHVLAHAAAVHRPRL